MRGRGLGVRYVECDSFMITHLPASLLLPPLLIALPSSCTSPLFWDWRREDMDPAWCHGAGAV